MADTQPEPEPDPKPRTHPDIVWPHVPTNKPKEQPCTTTK